MTYRKMMTVLSMAIALSGASAVAMAEDGSLRLRTMLNDRHGVGANADEPKNDANAEKRRSLMSRDELFLKQGEKDQKKTPDNS